MPLEHWQTLGLHSLLVKWLPVTQEAQVPLLVVVVVGFVVHVVVGFDGDVVVGSVGLGVVGLGVDVVVAPWVKNVTMPARR